MPSAPAQFNNNSSAYRLWDLTGASLTTQISCGLTDVTALTSSPPLHAWRHDCPYYLGLPTSDNNTSHTREGSETVVEANAIGPTPYYSNIYVKTTTFLISKAVQLQ
ncbi:Hypp6322 [Branchiostoma lanceolatum]|uniref:Hypp6322 protein n=1 Tax=Branchiostoma lanceolatum TaxID=7740 RepID=A0A8J9YT09_BRALA|nr:Hypp6322 [Branchiostoma lanceolatum]